MSTEARKSQAQAESTLLPEPLSGGLDAAAPRISRTWLLVGSVALMMGLIMGLIMSSLGK